MLARPTPLAAGRLAAAEWAAEAWKAVADRGRVSSYQKKGRTYYRIRIRAGGELVEAYRHKGIPFTSQQHAQAVLEQMRGRLGDEDSIKAIAEFLPAHSKPNLVSEKLQEYVKDLEKRLRRKQVSKYTLRSNQDALPRALRFWDGVSLHEIKKSRIEKYKAFLEDQELAPSSVKLRLDQFRAFLAWCVGEEILTTIPPMPEVQVVRKRPKLLTPSEQRRVLEQIPWDRRGIFMVLCLGVRPDSARAIRIEDVDRGFLWIHRGTQTANASDESVDHTKARKESWVPMSRDLELWIKEHCENRLPGALLFWNPTGQAKSKAWSHGALDYQWRAACEAAGLPYVPLYQGTKHSFATGRLMAGKSKDAVAEFMQISRRQVDTYAQWSRELSAEVLDEGDLADEARAKILELRGRK